MPCHCAEYGNVLLYTTLLFLIPMCMADRFNSLLIGMLIMTSLRYHSTHSKASRRVDVILCYVVALATVTTIWKKKSVAALLIGVSVPVVCYMTPHTSSGALPIPAHVGMHLLALFALTYLYAT